METVKAWRWEGKSAVGTRDEGESWVEDTALAELSRCCGLPLAALLSVLDARYALRGPLQCASLEPWRPSSELRWSDDH